MRQTLLPDGVIRVTLGPADAEAFAPVSFQDGGEPFLTQTGCVFSPRPVWRLSDGGSGETRQTANGEVVSFEGRRRFLRETHSAVLRFACPGSPVLTGLGAHEDGVFDYAGRTEFLYEHNMKIPIPFILSSSGWGLFVEAGCAMVFRGEEGGFTLELNAAEELNYLVIRGKGCAEVLRSLAAHTGLPSLLPKWAFGYIQSKERYRSAEELLAAARGFRRRGLGLDCIVLDWMSWKDGCWGDKTPDPARFPDVRALTDALHAMNVRLMVSVWPNADRGRDCDELAAAGHFLPASRIYDAFSPEAREMYWQQCRRFWMDGGTDALWCDSCEPITDPDWCGAEKRSPEERMRLITEASETRMDPETMNGYASCHLRGLRERWLRDFPDRRPLLLARSGGADSASLGAILWSGDISARWDVLEKQVTEAVRAGLSGIPWWTLDIGAFFAGRGEQWFRDGDYPEGVNDPAYRELYVRWFQFGAALPVFRAHGTDTPREPWAFGGENSAEYGCLRDMIRLRYRLLPYLYASAAQTCRTGLPMVRAMLLAFPDDPAVLRLSGQYMLGDSLLVKPVTRPLSESGTAEIVLPRGGGWYDLFTGEYAEGGQTLTIPAPLERFPLFVRAGAILPLAEGAQSTAALPVPTRELAVFCGADGSFDLYDDDGESMAFLGGGYVRIPMRYTEESRTLRFGPKEGNLPAEGVFRVRFHFPDGSARERELRYDGAAAEVCADGP